jgi:hypothetical protein
MPMQIPQDVTIQKQLSVLRYRQWLDTEFFSARWWALVAVIAMIAVVWWLLVRKSRLLEIGLFAVLAAVVFMGVGEYGEELTLWDYPVDLIAWYPPLTAVNFILLAAGLSLVYQRFETTASFLLSSALYDALVCFIAEPLLSAAGLYRIVRWHYYESFPVYFIAAVVLRSTVRLIYRAADYRSRIVKRSM